MEKGLTKPTASGRVADDSKPISLELNMDMVGLRVNSCPAKCTAIAKVM